MIHHPKPTRLMVKQLEDRLTPTGNPIPAQLLPDGPIDPAVVSPLASQAATVVKPVLITATEPGQTTLLRVDNSDGSGYQGTPFGSGFTGGATVAQGDVNHDGIDDVIVASGAGMPGTVVVYDGATRQLLGAYTPFGSYSGGLAVAAGDVNGNGAAEIVVSTTTGTSQVAVLNGATGKVIRQFQPYGGFTGGVLVAVGDVNHDGKADVIVAPAEGERRIRVYNGASIGQGQPQLLGGIMAFTPGYTGPRNIAAGDVNGDGDADIIVGRGSGSPKLEVFSGANVEMSQEPAPVVTQLAWPKDGHGIRVAFASDTDGDGLPDLVVSSVGSDKAARFLTTTLTSAGWVGPVDWFDPMPGVVSGVYVG